MDHGLFIHSPAQGHLVRFQMLAITSKAAINTRVQVCVDVSFQLMWVSTKECECWIIW